MPIQVPPFNINSDFCELESDAGDPTNHGFPYYVGGVGQPEMYNYRRVDGPVYAPDLCEDFNTVPSNFDFLLAFPTGEIVHLGTPSGPTVAGPGEWEIYGYTVPGSAGRPYYEDTVALDFLLGDNFLDKVTVPRPQITYVQLSNPITPAVRHIITIDSVPYEYEAVAGDNMDDVGTALAALIDAEPAFTAVWETPYVKITGQHDTPFSCSTSTSY